jgi:exonuclease III
MNRNWNILCWNIRGINSKEKCDALRNKIEESACAIVCIQETKREHLILPTLDSLLPKV